MRLKDILLEKGTAVVTIDAGECIHDAIHELNKNRIGALIVTTERDGVVGIITERDVLCKCDDYPSDNNQGRSPEETVFSSLIRDVMTTKLVSGTPEDDPDGMEAVDIPDELRQRLS